MTSPDFQTVSELAGEEISSEQLFRLCNRYYWAGQYCRDLEVLEVACGSGPGLGYLGTIASKVVAGDVSAEIVQRAKKHYGDRFDISVLDAVKTEFPDSSFDVVIIFEALYYVSDADQFVRECARLLRPGGTVLVSNANKDLFDFTASPYSKVYHGVVELGALFERHGFDCEFFGSTPVDGVNIRQRILRPVKALVASLGLMPKSMKSKRLLKRLVFGAPTLMPAEVEAGMAEVEAVPRLDPGRPDHRHKVIYCKATAKS